MYSTILERQQHGDGNFYWLAWHPELDYVDGEVRIRRCLAWGDTAVEAQTILADLCEDFVASLQEDSLPVPAAPCQPSLTIYATLDANHPHRQATESV